jgi:hypothetical protein
MKLNATVAITKVRMTRSSFAKKITLSHRLWFPKALETNRISLNEINSCSSAFLERFQHGAQHRERLIVEAKQIIATSPLFAP